MPNVLFLVIVKNWLSALMVVVKSNFERIFGIIGALCQVFSGDLIKSDDIHIRFFTSSLLGTFGGLKVMW